MKILELNKMGWFTRVAPHSHKYNVVAFDRGYYTSYHDSSERTYHHLTFSKCECGHRKVDVTSSRPDHGPITHATHAWVEQKILWLTDKSDVYDDNYQQTKVGTHLGKWEYNLITGVQKIVNILRNDQEFKKMVDDHSMVNDAFEQLEVVIKLHENIDTD
jgi:hypothetical protein